MFHKTCELIEKIVKSLFIQIILNIAQKLFKCQPKNLKFHGDKSYDTVEEKASSQR